MAQTQDTEFTKIDKKKSQEQYEAKMIEEDILIFKDDFCNHKPRS